MQKHSFSRQPTRTRFFALTLGLLLAADLQTRADSYTWTPTTSGQSWSVNTNWNPTAPVGGPSGVGDVDTISSNITATNTVNIFVTGNSGTAQKTLGVLNIGDTDKTNSFTLAAGSGGGSLLFDNGASNAQINQLSTSAGDTISAPMFLNNSLDVTNASTLAITLSGAITSNTAGTKTLTNLGTGTGLTTITGVIGNGNGAVAVTQNSTASTMSLRGANTFTGGVNIASGILNVTPAAAEVAGTNGALGASGNIVFSGGTLQYGNTNVSDYSTRFKNSSSAIILDPNGKAVTLGGGIDSSNTGGVTVVGSGLTLDGTNTYTGATTLNLGTQGSFLNIKNSAVFSTGTLILTNGTIDNVSGSDMTISNALQLNGSFTYTGSANNLIFSNSSVNFGTPTGTARTVTVTANTLTISGNMANGTTTAAFVKAGAGTLVLSGANTFTGGVTISQGILSVNSIGSSTTPGGLGQSNVQTTIGSGTLTGQLTYTGTGETSARTIRISGSTGGTILDQSGTGALVFSSVANPGTTSSPPDERKTLTLQGSTAGTGQLSGIVADATNGIAGQLALSVAKGGTGTWTLSGANTYSGGTTISGGTLLANYNTVSSTASSTGTGTVSVTAGKLGGTGRVLGAVTVSSGATLQGGDGSTAAGMLTLVVNPTLNTGSNIALTLGTGNTHSTLALAAGGFNSFDPNQNFLLGNLQNGTYDNIITGVASGVPTGGWTITGLAPGGYSFTDDGTNIDLSITAVPEPGTWAMGVLATLAGAYAFRRKMAAR